MAKYKVWECKIVVSDTTELPKGFDSPPRQAAIETIENNGIEIVSCFSGWGGKLLEEETKCVENV